jgi:hypothetical protein
MDDFNCLKRGHFARHSTLLGILNSLYTHKKIENGRKICSKKSTAATL